MRTEKTERWGNPKEISHVYAWTNGNNPLRYTIEVDERGCVMVRDLKGNAIHATHLLSLVDINAVTEHENKAPEVTA